MALSEGDVLTLEVNRLRLVALEPAKYWQRRGQRVELGGLIALVDDVERAWPGLTDEAAARALRLSLPGRVRGLGFELPEPQIAWTLSPEMALSRGDGQGGRFNVARILDGLRKAKRGISALEAAIIAARDIWQGGRPPSAGDGSGGRPPPTAGPLSEAQMYALAEIASAEDLIRAHLLGRYPLLVASFDKHARPIDQHYGDLLTLNALLRDPCPSRWALAGWLRHAERRLGHTSDGSYIGGLRAQIERYLGGVDG